MARETISNELLVIPDAGVTSERVLISRNPKTSGLAIYVSNDGGKTFRSMIPAPTKDTRKGSVLTIGDDGNAEWALPSVSRVSVVSDRQYIPFNLIGDLSTGAVFGYFKIPAGRSAVLHELILTMQDEADANVVVDVINGSAVRQNRNATINEDSLSSVTLLEVPLKMSSRSVWKMKVVQCGTSFPGQNLCVLAGIEFTS